MYIDATILEQMKACEHRNRRNPNSFRRVGGSNVFKNIEGRKIERVTVDGSITYRSLHNDEE